MSSVQLENLCKHYPDSAKTVVNNLNLEIQSGELVALLGPSGCGKTTTLRMIAGLTDPSAGDVRVDGQSLFKRAPEHRQIGMVFQKPLLFSHMTVFDNIAFGLRMHKQHQQIQTRVKQMLELVRLEGLEARRPAQLSGGQEQRVALARALITQPRVLLLDEPFSALDASLRAEMRELIVRLQQDLGTTMIFVTHDQEEAVMLAQRIALLENGELRQYDTPEGFYERPRDEVVARFFGGVNFFDGVARDGSLETQFGILKPAQVVAAGAVRLTIRPEAIRIVQQHGANTVLARVTNQSYLGTHTRLRCFANGVEIQLHANPSSSHAVGDELMLHLPPEQLWVFGTPSSSRSI